MLQMKTLPGKSEVKTWIKPLSAVRMVKLIPLQYTVVPVSQVDIEINCWTIHTKILTSEVRTFVSLIYLI